MPNGNAAVMKENMTEEMVTEVTLKSLKENKEGVTEYPILEFDRRALNLLCTGVSETLKSSKVVPAGGKVYKALKRAMDIVASGIGLIVLAIPMGITALAIYLDDKGNPFFSQVRLTENGKPFKMYKFRSMCVDAEARFAEVQKNNECDGLAFKAENDPRITKIGKFIRKASIDEFPQLWNVFKGDMSLIGPRPPLPREVVLYTPAQMDRLLVKGGLSCVCQVEGRSDMEFDKWVETDVKYIKERSLGKDISLLFRTLGVVLKKKGAR
jgi:lipopolysaccharide/colanic/teichoic acid biosynthesis glycosyltransferase